VPVNYVLLGIMEEGSGFDQGFYIWRVAMPLFVPTENVTLSWSERIGGGSRKFDEHDENALADAISGVVAELKTEDIALNEIIARGTSIKANRRVDEIVGYAQIIIGDTSAARKTLARAGTGATQSDWESEIADRVEIVVRTLERSGREQAIDLLDQWCDQTANALGLRRSSRSGSPGD
jgi:hypothetical protein